MSLALANPKVDLLKERAQLLKGVRSFFERRDVMEVDCPVLSHYASVDAHIDLLETTVLGNRMFLHSSPEYGMKRLLAEGVGDIYQLSHVFRSDEAGALHNPEFTMIEWYRMGFTLEHLIAETIELAALFVPDGLGSILQLTYDEAFKKYAALSAWATERQLLAKLASQNITLSDKQREGGKEALLNAVWALFVEPHLGKEGFTVITDFPKEQAALSRLSDKGTAMRFELYYNQFELANGYFELTDPLEQSKRFEEANQKREELNKDPLPVDPHFLQALEKGIPDCSGVAMGFDRLLMLKAKASHIGEILPFHFENV